VRAIDLYAGAGGLSRGFAEAGFAITAGFERDPDACATFAKAHPGAEVVEADVSRLSFRRWRGSAEVVIGGPPCQPWSSGGKRLGAEDARDCWPGFLRALREVEPLAFLAENVPGLAAGGRRGYFRGLLGELGSLGFTVTAKVLNAADYGVPQKRRRLLIVGARGRRIWLPSPKFGPSSAQPWRAAGEVLGLEPFGTPNPSAVTYARRPDTRPNPYDGHVYNGGGRPIDLARPAPTLLASMGGNKTPWVDTLGLVPDYHAHLLAGGSPRRGRVPGARRITVEEAALLQTFPASSEFCGSRSSQYRQVGNAVPPVLGKEVALSLLAQVL
jgi:DNA (cytosine-5)-methyltransferase 1